MDPTHHKRSITSTFQRAAAEFDRSGIPFFTPTGRRLVRLAAPVVGEDVLDVGCGRGSSLFPARELVGRSGSVTGIDIATEMVRATALDAADRSLDNVEVLIMDGEQPRFPAESFDVVLAGFSIMHMAGAPGCLAAYLPLLRPDGRFCFSELVDHDGLPPFVPASAFAVLKPHFPPGPDPKERGTATWSTDPSRIRSALTELGFDRVQVHEETFRMVVSSGRQWNEWTLSTGLRAAWDTLDGELRAAAWARTADEIESLRGADGEISLPVPVRYVIARRPARCTAAG